MSSLHLSCVQWGQITILTFVWGTITIIIIIIIIVIIIISIIIQAQAMETNCDLCLKPESWERGFIIEGAEIKPKDGFRWSFGVKLTMKREHFIFSTLNSQFFGEQASYWLFMIFKTRAMKNGQLMVQLWTLVGNHSQDFSSWLFHRS